MQNVKYITTTLPYANSRPHIGHYFEFVLADALSRYLRYSGNDVFFNIGLDEHGLKIQEAAKAIGTSPKDYVDKLLAQWHEFVEKSNIDSYDSFYRTSDSEHYVKVQQFWVEAFNRGDIYKKAYSGTYCIGCESFKLDKDLIEYDEICEEDGEVVGSATVLRCPDHKNLDLQNVEEENYFFKLSKYRNRLNSWAYKATEFIEPYTKRGEFLNFIDNVEDISISRRKEKVSWGIPVPGDEEQVIYVWFDALLNYLFASGLYEDESKFDKYWNNSEVIQICGPDNLKFQAIIFQGLLASAGIKHTDKLLVHGTILDSDGHKMSKSVGNVIDPIDQIEKYGTDAVRYYALAGLRTYGNSGWDEKKLVELHNSQLADDFGNLVSRVTHLAGKFLSENEDNPNIELDYSYIDSDQFKENFDLAVDGIVQIWNNYKVSEALDETNQLVKYLNKYINDEQPWSKQGVEGWIIVLRLHYAISEVNKLYYPVIPGKFGEVKTSLRKCEKSIIFPKIELKQS